MNDGIKILLERVKTHPEEFVFEDEHPFKDSKWRSLIHLYKEHLPKEDVEALQNAINTIIQEKFTAKVMEELLDPKEEEPLTLNPYSAQSPMPLRTGTLSGGATQGVSFNSISNGGTAVSTVSVENQLHQILHMKAQMELEKQKLKEKKSKTLFGKLFNYL